EEPITPVPFRPWLRGEALLGEWEEPPAAPPFTQAVFLTANRSVIRVQAGDTASLSCIVRGLREDETVSWLRQMGHHILTVGSVTLSSDQRVHLIHHKDSQVWMLQVRRTHQRDSGIYKCMVNTDPPMGILHHLHVIEAIAEITGGYERFVQQGSSVTLACILHHALAPPTFVFWYHHDVMINYEVNRQLKVVWGPEGSELHLMNVGPSDSGNYTCAPSNARPSSALLHVIVDGETPAAMQTAKASSNCQNFDQLFLISFLSLMLHLIPSICM
ncbi:unnamed protein product, partial [Meganyctiphanes norvegica]